MLISGLPRTWNFLPFENYGQEVRGTNTVLVPNLKVEGDQSPLVPTVVAPMSVVYTLFFKKSLPFLFLWLLGQVLTDFSNIWQYCSCKNLQPNDIFLSCNIQFLYEYYGIEKRAILYAFIAAASSCRRASFLQCFLKVCSVSAVLNHYSEILY